MISFLLMGLLCGTHVGPILANPYGIAHNGTHVGPSCTPIYMCVRWVRLIREFIIISPISYTL